jgi:nucleotide-binding universal stress UspA family protein
VKIILAPVDFSIATANIVEVAAALAAGLHAYVVLLHIVTAKTGRDALGRTEMADRELKHLKEGLRARSIVAQSLRLVGNPAADIIDQARKLRASLIVMGSRGHSRLHTLVAGSTTSAVIRSTNCPVVLLPALYRAGELERRAPRGGESCPSRR